MSVIIPAYSVERWPLLKRAVESARCQVPAPGEVIVCVDHNPDLSFRCRQEWGCKDRHEGPPVMVVDSRHPGHQGASRTTGAEVARGEFLLFLDDDAAATPGWLQLMLAGFDDPSVVAVGGAPLPEYPKPRPRWFPREFDWVFGCVYRGLPDVTAPIPRVIGTTMAVRRADLIALGGFHSDDHDDLDLSHRLRARFPGGSVIYEPRAVVRHRVHEHRLTWAYFWRRCFTVNRSKVGALRRMGAAANMGAERSFALGALTGGVATGLREL
ncbi:MAG: glycosyltransferase family 2 protein, partial [Candidatus Dormibacteraeota bacterium]|nr:glycosyltransferase family 2 protein [Candidatus Dormibacteraeota bacterium]